MFGSFLSPSPRTLPFPFSLAFVMAHFLNGIFRREEVFNFDKVYLICSFYGQFFGLKSFFGVVLECKLRALCLLGALTLELLYQPCFVLDIFEIGSLELFAWAGFKLRSS
jgi:hypothetical protein